MILPFAFLLREYQGPRDLALETFEEKKGGGHVQSLYFSYDFSIKQLLSEDIL